MYKDWTNNVKTCIWQIKNMLKLKNIIILIFIKGVTKYGV